MRKPKKGTTHLRIQTVHGRPFRRFGRVYQQTPIDVPIEEFTAEQISVLLGEVGLKDAEHPDKRKRRKCALLVTEVCLAPAAKGK